MIGKIIGAAVGNRIGRRYGNGVTGAFVGVLAPVIARRALGPLGLAIAGGYAAKKIIESRRERRKEM